MWRLDRLLITLLIALLLAAFASPLAAWTPHGQQVIGEQAARLVPPDLYRQLVRNRPSYAIGIQEPFSAAAPEDLFAYPDGHGRLKTAIKLAIDHAIASIRLHRPFNDIAYRMGVVAHYVALANLPAATATGDPEQRRWEADFNRYLESVEPRLELVFYGFRAIDRPLDLDRLVDESFARSRSFYPLLGREYRRIGFRPGVERFDDRSTAYALAALSYSHAVSDIAEVLRYIWLQAGGIDGRQNLPRQGLNLMRLRPPSPPSTAP